MRYLIDGYNLMHALGMVRKNAGEVAWLASRRKLLDWLADQLQKRTDSLHVVFDAQKSRGALESNLHRGVKIFIARGQSADDVIEELVAEETKPQQLTVVSNDHRLRDAAYRSECLWITCEAFTETMLKRAKRLSLPIDDSKPITKSGSEDEELLKIFSQPRKL